jgi:hypothetical protein
MNNRKLLAAGIKARIVRLILRSPPTHFHEVFPKLQEMHGWLLEAERAGQ